MPENVKLVQLVRNGKSINVTNIIQKLEKAQGIFFVAQKTSIFGKGLVRVLNNLKLETRDGRSTKASI